MRELRAGFTLIELLVVVAIIAILAAILFPVFFTAKQQAMISSCSSNVKELSKAVMMYVDDNNGWMVPAFTEPPDNDSGSAWTWRYCVMRYVKSDKIWLCPAFARSGVTWWSADPHWKDKILSSYGLNFNMSGANSSIWTTWPNRKISANGRPTKTLLVLECQNGLYFPYWQLLTKERNYLETYFPTFHRRKMIVSFLDGHTRHMFIKESLSTNPGEFMWCDLKPWDTGAIAEIEKLIQMWPRNYPPYGSD